MGVTITEEFKTEFEQVGPDGVRKRINAALYSNEKQKAAYEWLDERERGPDRSIARSTSEAPCISALADHDRKYQGDYRVGSPVSRTRSNSQAIRAHFWGEMSTLILQQPRKQEPPRQYRLGPQ